MPRQVVVHVRWEPDRSMRLYVIAPHGAVDVGTTHGTATLRDVARRAVAEMFAAEAVEPVLLVDRPPWLREGDTVRIEPAAIEEEVAAPYARVVGFLPIGGVLVVHPEIGSSIYPPESLEAITE